MFIIRLPNGNLRVPETAIGNEGRVIGNAYVEIGPQDADYARLAAQALTEDEVARRRSGKGHKRRSDGDTAQAGRRGLDLSIGYDRTHVATVRLRPRRIIRSL
jgi:DNA topoisomerase IA